MADVYRDTRSEGTPTYFVTACRTCGDVQKFDTRKFAGDYTTDPCLNCDELTVEYVGREQ